MEGFTVNNFRAGLNALENLGRTTPGPYVTGILTGARSVIEARGSQKDALSSTQSLCSYLTDNSCQSLPRITADTVEYRADAVSILVWQ